jgi:hypothetical protein
MLRIIPASLLVAAPSTDAGEALTPGEGFIDVEGGRGWYRVVDSGDAMPLLPGVSR